MDQGFRRGFTTAEKTELWDRWQRGESLKAIGRAFGKPSSSTLPVPGYGRTRLEGDHRQLFDCIAFSVRRTGRRGNSLQVVDYRAG